eukprot:Blabericola_migrator_1__11076@NODE_645_length_7097_cov_27_777525_g474_i0_p2_GENE_NODE_645_length_7097_cov_27_777525_g474_i0NODE_645_length_7097_cov_27_777525_g474_i0_p2_ORF_typecomplete_len1128_score239_84Cnd1/PF12717_7/1_3Cnd1/PF12717_7/6_3e02_NODE_645_length_7097_cov_27_777525_g474_i037007083
MPSRDLLSLTDQVKTLYDISSVKCTPKQEVSTELIDACKSDPLQAWAKSINLIETMDDSFSIEIHFFGANTLARLALKGVITSDEALCDLQRVLMDQSNVLRQGLTVAPEDGRDVSHFHTSAPIIGQLALALAAMGLWRLHTQDAFDKSWLQKLIQPWLHDTGYSQRGDAADCYVLLQVFNAILELFMSDRKLALSSYNRRKLARDHVLEMDLVLNTIHDASVICAEIPAVLSLCCQTTTSWFKTMYWVIKSDSSIMTAVIIRTATWSTLEMDLSEWLMSPESKHAVETYQALCHLVSECRLELYSHNGGDSIDLEAREAIMTLDALLLEILSHVVAANINKQLAMMSPINTDQILEFLCCLEDLSTSDLIYRALGEHREVALTPPTIGDLPDFKTQTKKDLFKARGLMTIALRCLGVPDVQIRIAAMKIFQALMANHVSFANQLEKDDTLISAVLNQEESLKVLLKPLMDILFNQIIPFPPVPDYDTFDFKGWFEMRDICATLIADMSSICQYETILEMGGRELERWVQFASQDPNAEVLFTRVEACLFSLTTVVSVAPAGKDAYVPLALSLLPQLQYPQDKYEGVLFRFVAARLLLWTAGFIGTYKHHCVALVPLASEFLTWIGALKASEEKFENASVASYIDHTERTVAEGIVAICSAASSYRAKVTTASNVEPSTPPLEEKDIHSLLEILTPLTVLDGTTLDSRSAILMAMGTLIGMMDVATVSTLHVALITSLLERHRTARETYGEEHRRSRESLKLLFVGFECLQLFQLPPLIPYVDGSEELNHPSMIDLRAHWSVLEQALGEDARDASDSAIEWCTHALLNVIGEAKWHFVGSMMLDDILQLLGTSMQKGCTVYHLNAVRGLIRVVGGHAGLRGPSHFMALLNVVIDVATREFQSDQRDSEDLLGMCVDILNVALKNSWLTDELADTAKFQTLLQQLVNALPQLAHPKVRLTCILFLGRLLEWLRPNQTSATCILPRLAQSPQLQQSVAANWESKTHSAHAKISQLIFSNVQAILRSFHCLVMTCFEDNICWLRLVAESLTMINAKSEFHEVVASFYEDAFSSSASTNTPATITLLFSETELATVQAALVKHEPDSKAVEELCDVITRVADESLAWHLAQ